MVEFTINLSITASTGFAPFESNYQYMPPRMANLDVQDIKYTGVKDFVVRARQNLEMAHDAIIESQIRATYCANENRSADPEFEIGQMVYLSTKNLNLPKNRAHKLVPKYIGPYKILEKNEKPRITPSSYLKNL
jgi:hypothetical protein